MKHFAVIGDPVEHSRSPEIYRELFEKHSINADLIKLRVTRGELCNIRDITSGLSGFAVTMPHKRTLIPYLDRLDESALKCGSVNIVSRDGGELVGYNTDGEGALGALMEAGFSPKGRSAQILGRGGAALAAAKALSDAGCEVTLLVRDLKENTPFPEKLLSSPLVRSDVFINASPLGMAHCDDFAGFGFLDIIKPDFLLDMVYLNDRTTALVREAEKRGIKAVDGSRMLYMQALPAFRIFTGVEA